MAAGQRGNAILISAILVFALTLTALGVSRMLVAWTRQALGQKDLLGVQAFELGTMALDKDIATLGDSGSQAAPGNSSYDFKTGASLPSIPSWAVSKAAVATTWSGAVNGPFAGTASVTYSGTAAGNPWTINRIITVQVASTAVPNVWKPTVTGPAGVGP